MRFFVLPLILVLTGCATSDLDPPSLEPRAAEALDPRLPVVETTAPSPVDAGLRARLDGLLADAETQARVFDVMAAGSVPDIEAAGAPGSESWTRAAELLSRLDAARAPVARAMADADALATQQIVEQAWVDPSNRDAIAETAARIAAIDARQASLIDRLTGILNP